MSAIKNSLFTGVLFIALLAGLCACDVDFYHGKRPLDYENSYWVCSEYGASFEVDENGDSANRSLTINGEKIPFSWKFSSVDNSVWIKFEIDETTYSWWGYCKFSKQLFSVSIEDTKGCYEDKEITLNFVREK